MYQQPSCSTAVILDVFYSFSDC
uniref:Uncharacterized protein n=1 Tax=Anguilla anguilla TaxID=7936 RepID=A0A0E9UI12_ANGAN